VDRAAKTVEELEVMRRNAFIYATVDGVVADKFVSQGEMVQIGTPLVSIVDTSVWKVELAVSDDYNEYIYRGADVEVRIDGVEGEFEGHIDSIIPRVDRDSRRVRFDVVIDEVPATVRDGLFARVTLMVPVSDTYRVPASYVSYGYDGPEIHSKEGVRAVDIVRDNGDYLYIKAEDLHEGLELM
jgi:multidrug efflux pump subunit AcrA (membrane-fusion protein)